MTLNCCFDCCRSNYLDEVAAPDNLKLFYCIEEKSKNHLNIVAALDADKSVADHKSDCEFYKAEDFGG